FAITIATHCTFDRSNCGFVTWNTPAPLNNGIGVVRNVPSRRSATIVIRHGVAAAPLNVNSGAPLMVPPVSTRRVFAARWLTVPPVVPTGRLVWVEAAGVVGYVADSP